jgi:hypothetical protein
MNLPISNRCFRLRSQQLLINLVFHRSANNGIALQPSTQGDKTVQEKRIEGSSPLLFVITKCNSAVKPSTADGTIRSPYGRVGRCRI